MRITYVLPQPELGGGNKVAAQHAAALGAAGFDVTMIADGPRPRWMRFTGRYIDRTSVPVRLPAQDLIVGTYWTTLAIAEQLQCGPVAHFCQGYEGHFSHLRDRWPEIEAVYQVPRPLLAVTPHLCDYLAARFGRSSRLAAPMLDPLFRPGRRRWPRRRPWIAVSGVFDADMKDVATALEAVRHLRASGVAGRLLRVSTFPLSDRERTLLAPDRFFHHVDPAAVSTALRQCDLALFTSRAEDGFGLPLLEAMASGVPAVASRIPSTTFMTGGVVPLVAAGDVSAFVSAARDLLGSRRHWWNTRVGGIAAAHRFSAARLTPQLVAAIQWASGRGSSTT